MKGPAFSTVIPAMQSKINPGKHVDMRSALTTADLVDGVHPTATGYDKIAAAWCAAAVRAGQFHR